MSSNEFEPSLVDRLRKENEDQFFTLVRMHLSFVLDLNTDETDTNEKSKYFKWNFTKKSLKPQGCNQIAMVNTMRTQSECTLPTRNWIEKIYEIIDFLEESENVCQEGIFRRTGSLSRQQELKQLIANGAKLNLSDSRFSVHDCASVLKSFLAELPEPLLQEQHYQAYCQLSAHCTKTGESSIERVLTGVQLLVLQLSNETRNLLKRLLNLLAAAASSPSSRMSAETLATLFTPHLLCPRRLTPEALHADSSSLAPVLSFMISNHDDIFNIPAKLATDIVAYLTVREKRRMLSPNGELDESVSDRTAANTVFTFVDRDRTAVENESNPTDTALAQLYAHIQALPDSQHKRRLVKQFNRENGYGTPRQLQRHQKLRPKSLGDSIKKHIFHKGLLNKQTPKKYQETISEGSPISMNSEIYSSNSTTAINSPLANDTQLTQIRTQCNEVSHRNIVLKNMASQISQKHTLQEEENLRSDTDSDSSNTSIHSESGILDPTVKLSPKFSSEPNLSMMNCDSVIPKPLNKRGTKLFRSKVVEQKPNIRLKRPIKLTPKIKTQDCTPSNKDYSPLNIYKTCVKCSNTADSCSEPDEGSKCDVHIEPNDADKKCVCPENSNVTPRLSRKDSIKCIHRMKVSQLITKDITYQNYGITSTPNLHSATSKIHNLISTPGTCVDEERTPYSTPYAPCLRRSSMSPITKSTQKMSKAMQESIMTPRSRKPVVVLSTCDQRDMSLFSNSLAKEQASSSSESTFDSYSPKNDSDFVSTDESNTESNQNNLNPQMCGSSSNNDKRSSEVPYTEFSNSRLSEREKNLRIIHERSLSGSLTSDKSSTSLLKARLDCESTVGLLDSEVGLPDLQTPTISEPFRKYLLNRSLLTAIPVDLSFNSPEDFGESFANNVGNLSEQKMSESLLYCLNGKNPVDSSYFKNRNNEVDSPLLVLNTSDEPNFKLRDITNIVPKTAVKDTGENISERSDLLKPTKKSPLRKRSSLRISGGENDVQVSEVENKKLMIQNNLKDTHTQSKLSCNIDETDL